MMHADHISRSLRGATMMKVLLSSLLLLLLAAVSLVDAFTVSPRRNSSVKSWRVAPLVSDHSIAPLFATTDDDVLEMDSAKKPVNK